MKKIKKLLALTVATITLAATAITANAVIKEWDEKIIEMGAVTNTYYLADNTIHYTDLLGDFDKNFIIFSGVDKKLMEGNIVLSVDFSNLNATSARDRYHISDELFEKIPEYMDGLYLMDANGNYITEGKYPLTVNYNAPKAYINVMVDTNWRVFNNFDLTEGCYEAFSYPGGRDYFRLHFQIKDILVLPSYKIILKEATNSSNPLTITGDFGQNIAGTYTKNGREYDNTTGYMHFRIPTEYRGKTFYAYINGMKVGKITLATAVSDRAALVNY